MGALDLRGRAIISDGASATLRTIKGNLDAVGSSASRLQVAANAVQTLGTKVQRAGAAVTAGGVAAGGIVTGLIDKTKTFNEAKFGYGFARITDYIKDGRLDMAGWRKDMDTAAEKAVVMAKQYGTLPAITMKTREEVEKLGFKGTDSESMFGAALGLHLSEPSALSSGDAAKYLGAVYRAYGKQREELAAKMGKDANEPGFVDAYMKGLAGKAAVAGAESALGPADIVEGMRQFAPQWAAMGVDYNFGLAMLAHGSNFGFRAPELGTAFKSMMTKIISPTDAGLRTLNALGIDRSQFMTNAPADPAKAAGQINTLLSGVPFGGKGGKAKKATVRAMLDTAYKDGTTGTPEFQQALSQEIMGMLGHGWEGRMGEVEQAVSNATITGQGGVKLPELLKKLRDQGATVGQIATIFEGRHVARYTPTFQAYEQMLELYDKIGKTDGTAIDAVVQGRKASEAGKTDALSGSWEAFMVKLEQSGGIIDKIKGTVTELNGALAGLPTGVLTAITGAAIGLTALGGAAAGLAGLRMLGMLTGVAKVAGTVAPVAAAAVGGAGFLAGVTVEGAAAGAAGAGAGAAGRGMLARAGSYFIPGVGWVLAGASLAGGAYGAYDAYSKGGTGWDVAKGFGIGAATFGLAGTSVQAAPAMAPDGAGSGPAAAMESETMAAIERMRASLAGVDFTSEGQRIGESLAAGLRTGLASAVAAIDEAGGQMRAAASRIQLNTGTAMGAAR